jgi:hypothetical protein
MTREDAEEILAAAGGASDDAFPLFEASLACAVHEDPSRDPEPARALAEQAAARLAEHIARPSTRPWPRPWPGICV